MIKIHLKFDLPIDTAAQRHELFARHIEPLLMQAAEATCPDGCYRTVSFDGEAAQFQVTVGPDRLARELASLNGARELQPTSVGPADLT